MPSTPDSILRLELQATGENANTWGIKTNNNIELLGQAIAGAANVNVGGSGSYTLVANNYTTDEARAATLVLTGTLSGNRDVIVPSSPKHYTIINQTSGAFPLTVRQVSGTGVAIPAGSSQIVCTSTTCVGVGTNAVSRTGDTMTGALGFAVGSSTTPGLFPAGDTDTGLFQPAPDTLAVSIGGTEVARFGANGLQSAAPWVDLPAETILDIGAVNSESIRVTNPIIPGPVTITQFGTAANGVRRRIRFAVALTVNHSSNIICPGAQNLSFAPGDVIDVQSDGSNVWRIIFVSKTAALPILPGLITGSGLTMATGRLLGRVTTATGAIEEIPLANTAAAVSLGINRGTEITLSGTSVDFTGIPEGVRRVTLMFHLMSTNGSNDIVFRLGKSGDPVGTFISTGYNGSYLESGGTTVTTNASSTTGFGVGNNSSARSFSGKIVFDALTNQIWVANGIFGGNGNGTTTGGIDLGGTLDRIRITTLGGTSIFDAGIANMSWEF